jgi:hypothetical protein
MALLVVNLDKVIGSAEAFGDAFKERRGFLSTDSAMRQTRPVVIEIDFGWPQ